MAPRRSGRRSGQQLRSASPPAPRGQTRQAGGFGEVRRQQFTVVVLGDWGRSPRMQYHALSLADQAHGHVHVVAYAGATPVGAVVGHKGITLWALPPPPAWLARCLPRPLALACKAVFQLLVLLVALLLRTPRCSHVLLQTPPCLPTFAACQLACWLRRSRLVTDWHNLGFTLLALSVRPGSALVRLAERYERSLGRRAHAHLCVTHALAAELQRPEWGVPSPVVLHDRPARQFRHITDAGVKHALFQRLRPILQASPSAQNAATTAGCDWLSEECRAQDDTTTAVTQQRRGGAGATLRPDRAAIVVSSTSWTPDEDLGMLLRAAKLYDDAASSATSGATLPRMLLIVTGKGPLRCAFEREAQLLALRHVAIRTAFLTAEDYALLLGSADLGISLHASSSGLDLPMKVVDMFGASLPVAALGYATLAELVNPGVNGVTFADAKQLAGHLRTVLAGFAGGKDDVAGGPTPTLARLRQGAAAWAAVRWDQEWLRVASPLFTDAP